MAGFDSEQFGEWLSAYVDGELDAVETKRVESILKENGEARRLLDELRRTAQLVSTLPRHEAPPSILEAIQLDAERRELLGGLEPQPVGRTGGRGWALGIVSSAAALVLVVGGVWYFSLGRDAPLRPIDRVAALAPATPEGPTGRGRSTGEAKRSLESDIRSDKAAAPADRASGGGGKTEGSLLAAATIDQKLQAGLGVSAVESHTFGNEPVQLQVAVTDPAVRDRLAERVARYLSDRRVANLSQNGKDDRGSAEAPGRFFYAGAPKKNFNDSDQRQILVRATRGELEGLMRQVALATGRDDSVALVSGPLTIHGLNRAQTILYGLADSTPTKRKESEALDASANSGAKSSGAVSSAAPTAPAGPDQFLDGLVEMLGLDRDALAKAGERSDAVAAAGKPAAAGQSSPEPAPAAQDSGRSAEETRSAASEAADVGHTSVAGNEVERSESKTKPDDDRPSLVTRREKALLRGQTERQPMAPPLSAAAAESALAEAATRDASPSSTYALDPSSQEPVVTLVVQIRVGKPDKGGSPAAGKTSHPPSKNGAPNDLKNPR